MPDYFRKSLLTFVLCGRLAAAQAGQPFVNEAKLVGAWVGTDVSPTGTLNPQELEKSLNDRRLVGVVVYNTDHTFVTYLCGPVALQMRELGMGATRGTWEVREDLLFAHATNGSKGWDIEERIAWDGEHLVVSNERMVRYRGKLPPNC